MADPQLPIVVIVGRPNVGKSSFLNHVAGQMISIVEETPGVTRDRISVIVDLGDRQVELVDTGGIGIIDNQDLSAHVEEQIQIALALADIVIFMVDARDGVAPLDETVAEQLRQLAKPTVLAVNKADAPVLEETAMEFHCLGLGEPVPMSIHQSFNTSEIMDRVRDLLGEAGTRVDVPDSTLQLAVCGKRNAGKSTFVNALAREERVIVSEVPGTTRDAVDVRFEKDGHTFIAIDTAGLRRKKSIQGDIDFYAQVRTERAIRRADVVLHFLDAPSTLSAIDKKIGEVALNSHKPVVLVVNKWDLAKDSTDTETYENYIAQHMPGLHFAPMVFTTALTGRNVWRAVEVAQNLHGQAAVRVQTAEVNKLLAEVVIQVRPQSKKNRKKTGKILYATQVAVCPPTFVLMVNDKRCFEDSYLRYLQNAFRKRFPFPEVPIKLLLRQRTKETVGERLERTTEAKDER